MALLKPRFIVGALGSRMGNLMFQLAYAEELHRQGYTTRCAFDIDSQLFSNPSKSDVCKANLYAAFPHLIHRHHDSLRLQRTIWEGKVELPCAYVFDPHSVKFSMRHWYWLNGWFMAQHYFAASKARVRELFCFDESRFSALAQLCDQLERDVASVSLHVRRGDYVSQKYRGMYGDICTPAYYKAAMELMRAQSEHAPHFYLFSDDPVWCEQAFAEHDDISVMDARHEEGYQDWWDMALMTHCHHNIIANSSFSWWGAWLNTHATKLVVCPERWDNKGIAASGLSEICVAGWQPISLQGELVENPHDSTDERL